MFQVHLPAIPLRNYIESYWICVAETGVNRHIDYHIMVDGKPDLLFNFGYAYPRQSLNNRNPVQTLTYAHLDAQRTYPLVAQQAVNRDLVGVRFRPGGLTAFLHIDAYELLNQQFRLRDLFGTEIEVLEARLYDLSGQPLSQVEMLDHFFHRRLNDIHRHDLVQMLVNFIIQHGGRLTIDTLCHEFAYSERNLRRLFRQHVGLSPKQFARIQRIQQATHLITLSDRSLSEIALQCGFYDQAHFHHDFVAFTGYTPHTYRQKIGAAKDSRAPDGVIRFA
jgi:AraC-like DNA-binding protein